MAISTDVRTVPLPSGETAVVLGQGTWGMGEDRRRRAEEISALRLGLDPGMRLIDTAEMYADGSAEAVVGEAISGRRASLKRLRTDRLDLYLLHWRGSVPLVETLEAFDSLAQLGDIRYWGVSNFDTADMEELVEIPEGRITRERRPMKEHAWKANLALVLEQYRRHPKPRSAGIVP